MPTNGRPAHTEADRAATVRLNATELEDGADLDPLLERIGNARYVLLGEASHGTSDYYLWRARLSRRLIEEKGFSFIAVEGDWPDCYDVNRYIKNYPGAGATAHAVLDRFDRWPSWMWANWEVVAFTQWLRGYNDRLTGTEKIGFYGLDVYSLWESMRALMDYLERTDADALESAREAFACFEPYARDETAYARATALVPSSCENEVVQLLSRIRADMPTYPQDHEGPLNAERNAQVMVDAERYYRAMVRGGPASWNIRDEHMIDTLEQLMAHHGNGAKAIVWEHNTHVGDARATDMADAGMINVGQRVRERHAEDGVVLVGFGSYEGEVIAGDVWGSPMRRMPVPEARAGSWEAAFHAAGAKNRLLLTAALARDPDARQPHPHRAIGVVYNPDHERYGNYVPTVLTERYDAFVYIDRSEALHPLHLEPRTDKAPQTYPWGF